MKGFKTFLLRGNLVDLAVAVVIGVAFNAVVQALVNDLITPLISAVAGQPNFSKLTVTIHHGTHHATFTYGLFLSALISFLIISAVVYFLVVSPVSKVLSIMNRNKAATERACPECLSEIPVAATRCMYCTTTVPPVEPAPAKAVS